MSLCRFYASVYDNKLLLAMSSHVYLKFTPRGDKPPSTLRDSLNSHLDCRLICGESTSNIIMEEMSVQS